MLLKEVKVPVWVTLSLALFAYGVCYLSIGSLPGNGSLEGWWGWYDQGEYLRSAKAFTDWDFYWKHHQYPPFYPVMGALFVKLVPTHPFFFFNIAAFAVFVLVFERVAGVFVTQLEALALVVVGVFFNATVMDNFVVPWTTTGTALIYSFAIFRLMLRLDAGHRLGTRGHELRAAFLFSAVFSLEAVCRPVDAGAAAIFYPAYLYITFQKLGQARLSAKAEYLFLQCLALGTGLLVGIGLFMLFNWALHGQVLGAYIQNTASYSGYFPLDIPRRAFFLFFDSNSVFLAPHSAIVDKFPWLIFGVAGMVIALIRGSFLLKVLAAVIVWQFCLYAAYGDLTPIGMWRWQNVHYFKWMFPYLALFAWLAVRQPVASFRSTHPLRAVGNVVVLALVVAAVLSVKFRVTSFPLEASLAPGLGRQVQLLPRGQKLDLLDISGITGEFDSVYSGAHVMVADGKLLKHGRDFRVLTAPWGVRIQFNQRIRPDRILFIPDERLQIQSGGFNAMGSTYRLGLGRPRMPSS